MLRPTDHAPRWQGIDLVRGVAIVMMAVFHIGWHLYFFGWSATDVTTDLPWVLFQKLTLGTFVFIAGATLVLAHGRAIRWRPFWRRFGVLVAAALAVSAGTYLMFPEYFVFFGVLHALALFSLLALPFLRLDWRLVALCGIGVIAANALYDDEIFRERWLAWIGFWPLSPETADIVPIFPWFGVELFGLAAMRAVLGTPLGHRLAALRLTAPPFRALGFIGRWSLPIYLIHQPILIGIMMLVIQVAPPVPAEAQRDVGFVTTCEAQCTANRQGDQDCVAYCSCALDQVRSNDLWAAVGATKPSAEAQSQISQVAALCTALSRPAMN